MNSLGDLKDWLMLGIFWLVVIKRYCTTVIFGILLLAYLLQLYVEASVVSCITLISGQWGLLPMGNQMLLDMLIYGDQARHAGHGDSKILKNTFLVRFPMSYQWMWDAGAFSRTGTTFSPQAIGTQKQPWRWSLGGAAHHALRLGLSSLFEAAIDWLSRRISASERNWRPFSQQSAAMVSMWSEILFSLDRSPSAALPKARRPRMRLKQRATVPHSGLPIWGGGALCLQHRKGLWLRA